MALSIWSSAKIDGYYVRVVLSGLTVRAGLFVELVFSHSRPGSFLIAANSGATILRHSNKT
jgi:hypothetical protein